MIYAGENRPVLAAKAATKLIPIVFRIGGDPIQLGLVTSLNRPGGKYHRRSFLSTVTGTVRLQMLHEAVPNVVVMGLLVSPTNPNAEADNRGRRKRRASL